MWINWHGGPCPVPKGTLVDVEYRNGRIAENLPALVRVFPMSAWRWEHENQFDDIVKFRVKKDEQKGSWKDVEEFTGWNPTKEKVSDDIYSEDERRETAKNRSTRRLEPDLRAASPRYDKKRKISNWKLWGSRLWSPFL